MQANDSLVLRKAFLDLHHQMENLFSIYLDEGFKDDHLLSVMNITFDEFGEIIFNLNKKYEDF